MWRGLKNFKTVAIMARCVPHRTLPLPSKFYRPSPNLLLAQRLDIDDAKGATVIAGMREFVVLERGLTVANPSGTAERLSENYRHSR